MPLVLSLLACPVESDPKETTADAGETTESENCAVEWWPDADGDGYGANGSSVKRCDALAGFADQTGDCNDADVAVNPGAAESCNLIDDNCDGVKDDENTTWFMDVDGDGYGADETAVQTCEPVAGAVTMGGDCDDTVATSHPNAEELCNSLDDNCDGVADIGIEGEWYADDDVDGYGNPNVHETTCLPPAGWVQNDDDCRPGDALGFPGSDEYCNSVDDNCDGVVDEGYDQDGDGHFDSVCSFGDDCDDTSPNIYTGAREYCENGADDDCDGEDPYCGYSGDYDLEIEAEVLLSQADFGYMGYVMLVGDATGDGEDDIFTASTSAGGGYLIPGPLDGSDDMDNVGTKHQGVGGVSGAGRSIGMGDVDGDGLEDIGFGAPYSTDAGMFVIYGPADVETDLGQDYDAYLRIQYGLYGGHGGDIGDVSGDGVADMVVGAYRANEGGGDGSGAGYVKFGPVSGEYSIDDCDAVLAGESPNAYLGRWAEVGGDHDGDGIGDIMIAAPYANKGAPASGAVYLVYGPPSGTIALSGADATFVSTYASTYLGENRTFVQGDVDGDGLDDATVGGTYYGGNTGIMSVMFSPSVGEVDITTGDIVITGASAGMAFGWGPSAEDADADGKGDLLIGAASESGGAGGVYVFWGLAAGTYSSADADAHLMGASGDNAGTGNAWADMNQDGLLDAVIGAYNVDGHGGVYTMYNFQ